MKQDSHTRTLVKTITWRLIATGTTITAAYILTGQIGLALGIGGIEATAKLFFYYMHERAWARTSWGKVRVHTKGELIKKAVKKIKKEKHGLVSKIT